MKPSTVILCISVVLIGTIILFPDPSFAAPGALIKAAAKSFWGKVIFSVLILIFLPLVIWFLIERSILVRRTRRILEKLGASDPRYNWLELKERITQIFIWVHSAWDLKKMDTAAGYVKQWYIENQQLQLNKWKRDGVENIVSDVRIKQITPLYLCRDPSNPEKDRLVLEINAELRDYLVDIATGQVIQGDKTLGELTTVWNFVWEKDRWLLAMIEEAESAEEYLKRRDKVILPPDRVSV